MLKYYKKNLITIVSKLNEAKIDPFSNSLKWLSIQESVIKSIVYIESKILKSRLKIKSIKYELSSQTSKLSKQDAKIKKDSIIQLKKNIDSYYNLRVIYKSIIDGIAFTFIDRFDIKPQSFKQNSGFLAGKKGNRLERKSLRWAFDKGLICILNDITNVLMHFDLTIILDYNKWIPIELKSSNYTNERVKRQIDNGRKLLSYILEDTPTDISNSGNVFHRKSLSTKIENYTTSFNQLISKTKTKEAIIKEIEPGLHIFICHTYIEEKMLHKYLSKINAKIPIVMFLNDFKFADLKYLPLCLLFNNAEDYVEFLMGNLFIIQVVDLDVYNNKLLEYGYYVDYSQDDNYMIDYKLLSNNQIISKLSKHYFNRIFFELISPNWLILEPVSYLRIAYPS